MTLLKSPCDDGVIRSAPVALQERASPGSGRWVLVATILGSSIAFIDGSAVTVALPVLQRDFGATAAQAQWVVQAYSLFLAALLLLGGSLGDRFGRRRIYAIGIALFTLASVACGLAPTVAALIAARAVQGVGGALLVPGSLAIISATFGDEAERGRAIGTWSGFSAVSAAIGPVLGGWLVQSVSWRAVFFINVPFAAVVLFVVARYVPESRDEEAAGRLDLLGALLATVGLGGVVYGLVAWSQDGLEQPAVITSLAAGAAALALFLVAEARGSAPMLPLGLFRSRMFSGTNGLTLLLYGALSGALYYLPFNLQQVQGYSATAAGASLVPFTVIMFGLSRFTGGLVARYGVRPLLTIGPLVAACGFLLFAIPGVGGNYWTTYFPAVVVMSLGMVITVAPLTTSVMGAVEERHAGIASGVNNAVSRTAGVLAIAVMGILVASTFSSNLDSRLVAHGVSPDVRRELDAQRSKLAAIQVPAGVDEATAGTVRRDIQAAFVGGFRVAVLTGAGLTVLGAAVAFWTTGSGHRGGAR